MLARQGVDAALLSNQVLYGACSTMPVAMLLFRSAAEPLPAVWLMHDACMHACMYMMSMLQTVNSVAFHGTG